MSDDFEFGSSPADPVLGASAPLVEEESPLLAVEDTESEVVTEDTVEEDSKEEPQPRFSKEELLKVFDDILFQGFYEEQVMIKGKLAVTFKSRSMEEVAEVSRRIDSASFNLVITANQHSSLYNLCYSLTSYNSTDLTSLPGLPSKKDEKSRYDFIKSLPAAVIASLTNELSKFDIKVHEAIVEGNENF